LFTVAFWKAASERAIKTAAQSLLLCFGASDVGPANLFELDWQNLVGFGVFGAVTSILTSIVSVGISDGNGPSLAPAAEIAANSDGDL
jgi:hypothetical protein